MYYRGYKLIDHGPDACDVQVVHCVTDRTVVWAVSIKAAKSLIDDMITATREAI